MRDLERLGAELVEVSLPTADYGVATYYLIAPAECSSNLARFDGVRYGLRVEGDDVRAMYDKTRAAGFGPEVKRRILIGTHALSSGYYDAYYVRAQKARTLIARDFDRAFARCDLIACPAASSPAFEFGAKSDPYSMYLMDYYTIPMALAGLPALSVPCGWSPRRTGRRANAGRLAARGSAVRREAAAGRGARVRTRDAARAGAQAGARGRARVNVDLRSRHRHRVPRRAQTRTKMFCGCANEFGGEPNTKVCPVCLGMPGAFPCRTPRRSSTWSPPAWRSAPRFPAFSKFDRKNYFYPDMPKDYQISQYDMPLDAWGLRQILARGWNDARMPADADPSRRGYRKVDARRFGGRAHRRQRLFARSTSIARAFR